LINDLLTGSALDLVYDSENPLTSPSGNPFSSVMYLTQSLWFVADLGENKKWGITTVSVSKQNCSRIIIETSPDATNWTLAVDYDFATPATQQTINVAFTSVPEGNYRYMKFTATSSSSSSSYIGYLKPVIGNDQIQFTTAPANNAPITADFKTKYIPKNSSYVLDFSVALNHGAENPT
jgi:hypothetical protein